ncbi:hypothetical protein EJB05_44422, partial [Eragrostis curvula]
MATKQSSTSPSFFNFLKEGVLLPTRNRKLFAGIFVTVAASTLLLLLGYNLAVQPLTNKLNLDTKALNSTHPGSPDLVHLIQEIQDDTRQIMLVGAAFALFAVIIGSIFRIIILFAAVATYSGELHTFGTLLGKAKAQLKGPLVTLAFVYVLELAYFAFLAALVALRAFLVFKHYFGLFFVEYLVLLLACIFFVYFFFLCSLSVVVAVAEPGCHGASALVRAWRLMQVKKRRAMLFIFVTGVLGAVLSPVQTLAQTCVMSNLALGLLLESLYSILIAAVGLFASCAMTAFYYECKGSTDASATEYVKMSTQEPVSA